MTGDDLRDARNALGMTQAQMAAALRLAPASGKDSVRQYERGRRPVPGPVQVAVRYMLEFGPLPD